MDRLEFSRVWNDLSTTPGAWLRGESSESVWRGLLWNEWVLVDAEGSGSMHFSLLRAWGSVSSLVLPKHQLEVLARAALGQAGKVIAHQLELSPSHVSTLLSSGLRRLGFRSRAELVWFCRDRSDLGPPPDLQAARFRWYQEEFAVLGFAARPAIVTAGLTRSEQNVIIRVLEGRSNRQIARELGTSVHTVGNQVAHARAKLGARSRLELIRSSSRWTSGATTPSLLPNAVARRFVERLARTERGS